MVKVAEVLPVLPPEPEDLPKGLLETVTISDDAAHLLQRYFVSQLVIFLGQKCILLLSYRGSYRTIDKATLKCLLQIADFDVEDIEKQPLYSENVGEKRPVPSITSGEPLKSGEAVDQDIKSILKVRQIEFDEEAYKFLSRFITYSVSMAILEAVHYAAPEWRRSLRISDFHAISRFIPWPFDKWIC